MLYETNILLKQEHQSQNEVTVYQNIVNGEVLCVSSGRENIRDYECCRKIGKCIILEISRIDSNIVVYRVLCRNIKCQSRRKDFDIKTETMWKLIVKTFKSARIYVRTYKDRKYLYVVNALTDNIPPPDPILQSLIAEYIVENIDYSKATKVLAPEALGLPLGSLVSYLTGLPYAIARKRTFPAKAIIAKYRSGYEEGKYFIYGVESGDRILFVDDAVSTGGTAKAIIEALEKNGVEVAGIASAIAKPQYGGIKLMAELGYEVIRAVDVYVYDDGRIKLVQPLKKWSKEFKVPVLE